MGAVVTPQEGPAYKETKMDGEGYPLKCKLAVGGGIFAFIAILFVACMAGSIHTIQEGNVGIYYVQGALEDRYALPGVRFQKPFITEMREITIRPTTRTMQDITTVTKDGIEIIFHDIQVLSSVDLSQLLGLVKKFGSEFRRVLIYDRVSEDLRLFCANHTIDEVYNNMFLDIVANVKTNVEESILRLGDKSGTGIRILNLVVPKPDIPRDIATNYKKVKVQWTEQLVAIQQQKTEQIKKETESIKAILDAEREKDVLEIELQKELLKKQKEKEVNNLEIQIIKSREENQAD